MSAQVEAPRPTLDLLSRWKNFEFASELWYSEPWVGDLWTAFREGLSDDERRRLAQALAEQEKRMARL